MDIIVFRNLHMPFSLNLELIVIIAEECRNYLIQTNSQIKFLSILFSRQRNKLHFDAQLFIRNVLFYSRRKDRQIGNYFIFTIFIIGFITKRKVRSLYQVNWLLFPITNRHKIYWLLLFFLEVLAVEFVIFFVVSFLFYLSLIPAFLNVFICLRIFFFSFIPLQIN